MTKKLILTKNLYLKEVSLKDVNYIFKLRSNKELTRYLNPRKNDTKKKQLVWLKKYLERRKNKKEFYFIFQIKTKNKFKNLGFARVIHLNINTFHFGGWIIEKTNKPWVALESCMAIYQYAFHKLRYKKALLWINLKNTSVIKFHKFLGAKFVKKDKKETFLSFTKDDFKKIKLKFKYHF